MKFLKSHFLNFFCNSRMIISYFAVKRSSSWRRHNDPLQRSAEMAGEEMIQGRSTGIKAATSDLGSSGEED